MLPRQSATPCRRCACLILPCDRNLFASVETRTLGGGGLPISPGSGSRLSHPDSRCGVPTMRRSPCFTSAAVLFALGCSGSKVEKNETGAGSISGKVVISGQPDPSNVLVAAQGPTPRTTTTSPFGDYRFD